MPIAAVVGERRHLEVWRTEGEALHTGTFVAHPLAVAGALAALEVLARERLVERAAAIGDRLARRLAPLEGGAVVEVRGLGALWGIELADAARARALVARAREAGVLLLAGGPDGRVIELSPPLVITDAQLDAALGVIAEALAAAELSPRG
jgi:4-aminobutyrate aminotransferase-like enzyme